MVTTSGFAGTPASRVLILGLVTSSVLASVLDIKHLLPLKPNPHLWPYLQLSRILTFQLAYISSTELLFAVVLLYQARVLERLWGARRYASLVIVTWTLSAVLVTSLGIVLKVVTLGRWGYIPPGVTSVVVSLLVVWREDVPQLYGFKVISGLSSGVDNRGENGSADASSSTETSASAQEPRASVTHSANPAGLILSDKFMTYIMAAQLALSQFPYQLLPALVGWVIGVAWREELLPTSMMRWRIPAWMVGESSAAKGRGQYEGLRRRLEEEGGRDGMREVSDRVVQDQQAQRRGIGQRMMGYFTSSA